MGKSLLQNSKFVILEKGIFSITGIIIVPFMINHLGMEEYGLWVLITALCSYLPLAGLGMVFSLDKYIAEFEVQGNNNDIKKLITTVFWITLFIAILLFVGVFFLKGLVAGYFFECDQSLQMARYFQYIVAIMIISFLADIFIALPKGLQRFDLVSVAGVVRRIVFFTITIILLNNNYGFMSLVLGTGAGEILYLLISILAAKRVFPNLSINPYYFNITMLKKMVSFGLKLIVAHIAMLTTLNFDKILISSVIGVQFVAIYDIGGKLINFIKIIPMLIFSVVIPRASQLDMLNERDALHKLYIDGTKLMTFFSFLIIAALFPLADNILTLWIGSNINYLSIYTFKLLLIGAMFQITCGFGSAIGRGINKPGIEGIANTFMLVTNIVFSSMLIFFFGYKGVVFGTLLAYIVNPIAFYLLLNKNIGINSINFFRQVLSIHIPLTLLMIFITLWINKLITDIFSVGRTGAFFQIAFLTLYTIVVFTAVFWIFDRGVIKLIIRTLTSDRRYNTSS